MGQCGFDSGIGASTSADSAARGGAFHGLRGFSSRYMWPFVAAWQRAARGTGVTGAVNLPCFSYRFSLSQKLKKLEFGPARPANKQLGDPSFQAWEARQEVAGFHKSIAPSATRTSGPCTTYFFRRTKRNHRPLTITDRYLSDPGPSGSLRRSMPADYSTPLSECPTPLPGRDSEPFRSAQPQILQLQLEYRQLP